MLSIDPHVSLAFTLASSPGSYCVLLGAGISISAGVPTAWGVQQDLIARLVRAKGEQPGDLSAWYAATFGQEPTYDHLLEGLAPTAFERQSILRAYFEPPDEEPHAPSPAHLAVARLVASGHVRVVFTTNFDRLLEAALHSEGVQPTVVASPSDIGGLPPLHLINCLVVHLHGDYLTPTAMLNTAGELASYDAVLDQLLDRVLDDHGLLIVGWSGTWDVALRRAVARRSTRRFTTYWVEPACLGESARDLAAQQQAHVIGETADGFLSELGDAVAAVSERTRDPRTLPTLVAAAKRELAGARVAIPLHDRMRREHDRMLEQALVLSDPGQAHANRVKSLEESSESYMALVATTAYWGTGDTDAWWLSDLPRLGEPSRGGGEVSVLQLRQVPAMLVLHTAGIAALAAGRWGTVARLLDDDLVYRDIAASKDRPLYSLSPSRALSIKRASAHVFELLSPIFATHLGLGSNVYLDCWERFEYVRLVATTDWGLRANHGYGSDLPHIRADGRMDKHEPIPARWATGAIKTADHPLLTAGGFQGDIERFASAVKTYNESFGRMADEAAWSSLPPGGGALPSGPFYPDEMPQWR